MVGLLSLFLHKVFAKLRRYVLPGILSSVCSRFELSVSFAVLGPYTNLHFGFQRSGEFQIVYL